jgi:hypothetical protein
VWRLAILLCAGCDQLLSLNHIDPPPDGLATAGPFAHYTMDALVNGAVIDDVAGNDATCTSCPITDAAGAIHEALDFNVVAETHLVIPGAPFAALDAFSVSVWIRVDELPALACFLNKPYGGGAGDSWQLCTAGFIGFYTAGEATELNTDQILKLDQTWHHVAAVFDGATKSIWFDGQPQVTDTAPTPLLDSHDVLVGADIDIDNQGAGSAVAPLHGALDDLQIFAYALDATAIENLYLKE